MKRVAILVFRAVDILAFLMVYPAAFLLRMVRRIGVQRLPLCKNALLQVGVFPLRNHYYEPQFDFSHCDAPLSMDRTLPGIDWNAESQLAVLAGFTFADELADTPLDKPDRLEFYMNNSAFVPGDAEIWYHWIRKNKPSRIIEIGSGNSTLMARKAIRKNRELQSTYQCEHICVEPYEMPWLENSGVSLIRSRVEDVDLAFFNQLEANDVLFIDSSHVIRPTGDVVFEYLQILPTLREGVVVHIHDIFSPRNYPQHWVKDEVRLWNEQYLLETILSYSASWKVILAMNYLYHHHHAELSAVTPFLRNDKEPSSLYIQSGVPSMMTQPFRPISPE
jgi:hypothetical protein